ncbi:unnamed protein product [Protopolystoma xenopodis]|uniref:Uncharacterized protein n=1 Tax=Protopolystoma xenopodis TaxID=117903 RepID=A0A448WXD5_9PLAT|nr:unnamed protein product [Protopolystoma xenopodis]
MFYQSLSNGSACLPNRTSTNYRDPAATRLFAYVVDVMPVIFRKLADVQRELELTEQHKNEPPLSSLPADHPVRRLISKLRRTSIISEGQQQNASAITGKRKHSQQRSSLSTANVSQDECLDSVGSLVDGLTSKSDLYLKASMKKSVFFTIP